MPDTLIYHPRARMADLWIAYMGVDVVGLLHTRESERYHFKIRLSLGPY